MEIQLSSLTYNLCMLFDGLEKIDFVDYPNFSQC